MQINIICETDICKNKLFMRYTKTYENFFKRRKKKEKKEEEEEALILSVVFEDGVLFLDRINEVNSSNVYITRLMFYDESDNKISTAHKDINKDHKYFDNVIFSSTNWYESQLFFMKRIEIMRNSNKYNL